MVGNLAGDNYKSKLRAHVHEDHEMTGGSYNKCINSQRNDEYGQLGAVGGCRLKNRAHRAQ